MLPILTTQKIERMAYLAEFGKSQSVRTRYTRELRATYKRYRAAVNRRISNLESRGYTYSPAYQLAMAYAPSRSLSGRFGGARGVAAQKSELIDIAAIMRDPTSTLRGMHQRYDESLEMDIITDVVHGSMKDLFENFREQDEWRAAKEFLEFLGSASVKEYLSLYKPSDEIPVLYEAWRDDKAALKEHFELWRNYQRHYEDKPQLTTAEIDELIHARYSGGATRLRL